MENVFWLYLITRLDAVNSFAAVITFVLFSAGGFAVLYGLSESVDEARKLGKNLLTGAVVAALICAATPTKSDAMFIAGGAAVIEASKSETAQRIASKSVEAVERWLDFNMGDKK